MTDATNPNHSSIDATPRLGTLIWAVLADVSYANRRIFEIQAGFPLPR